MEWPLFRRVPQNDSQREEVLDRFLDYVTESGVELYPAQEEAILELFGGKNVILNTPTGSGKSLVATALHFHSLSHGRRSIYTCPIKALVNEKFLALCRDFGPEQVGMITGDASVNPGAPILCCTAEILSNDALRLGAEVGLQDIIMDEFHYFSDRERGVAWQIPLLTLTDSRFLLMSATLGDTKVFEEGLTWLTGRESVLVRSNQRPVPLDYEYRETPIHETVQDLVTKGKAPVYIVHFTQREAAEEAQNLLSVDFCTKEEKRRIDEALQGVHFSSPYGKDMHKLLRHGIGLHHAGLLPKYRVLVEKLAQKGLLKLICGTDTLGVGVNVPIRTVLFTKLCKFDGQKTAILSVRDFQQIAGRAGRRGFDTQGTVVAQAPEHVIENLRMEQKAAGDPKKMKKIVKRKPPEKGYVAWNKETFEKLIAGEPEPLVSRFKVTHGMVLNVLSRPSEGSGKASCRALRNLIRDSYDSDAQKKQHRRTAFQLFRSLVERKIIELAPLRVSLSLQEDFSLNQTLSLYLIDTIQLLDPMHPEFALDVLTLVESILEDPDVILRKQLDRLKTERMAEMKMEGIDYDERIEELEKVEYPKPRRDFIYDTFNEFARLHPWVGQENIRPKSIAREMYETFATFPEYIRDYGLQRAEGILLRYLSEVYKALVQTVPGYAKNDELYAMTVFFGDLVRRIDSSLLDEWERMRNPDWVPRVPDPAEADRPVGENAADITRDLRAFTVLVRNEVFQLVRALSRRDYEAAAALLEGADLESVLRTRMEEYFLTHARLKTDTQARAPVNTRVTPREGDPGFWEVEQVFVDPEGHNDWMARLEVDLVKSRDQVRPVLRFVEITVI